MIQRQADAGVFFCLEKISHSLNLVWNIITEEAFV